tara:strand:- start:217 stop:357 length:141 start_codon:yes stop_codon:yes gene_type:complete
VECPTGLKHFERSTKISPLVIVLCCVEEEEEGEEELEDEAAFESNL